jgi:hypothetical protein
MPYFYSNPTKQGISFVNTSRPPGEFEVSKVGEGTLRVRAEGGFGAVLAVERVPKGKVLAKIGEICSEWLDLRKSSE